MATTIYFIRHAQSHPTINLPHAKWPLSDLGKNQALKLADLIQDLKIEKVISSPFLRCIDTIKPFIAKQGLTLETHEEIRERQVVQKVVKDFKSIWLKSWSDFDFKMPECESSREAQNRFVSAVKGLANDNEGRTIAVSTHGNVLGLFLNYIDSKHAIQTAEKITNPDVLRVFFDQNQFKWDESFCLPGLDQITSHHDQTPVTLK